MMSWKPQHAICLCFAFLLALFLHSQAHADTYQLFQFTDYNGAGPVIGLDNSGDVLYPSYCTGSIDFSCFSVFQPFGPGYTLTTRPPFPTPTVGGPCPVVPLASLQLCNNGYEAYWITPAVGGPLAGVYGGPITDIQRFPSNDIAQPPSLFLNEFGDLAWTDGTVEENFLAYDLTAHQTPEPATLALLTTGLVLLAIITRRRLISSF
jgi:hypothetical protein